MSEKNMNWEFLANKDYAFLTEDPALGDNVILLTFEIVITCVKSWQF